MLVAVCGLVASGIAVTLIYWTIRYHRKSENELPPQIEGNIKIETAWTVIPFFIFMGIFGWGAKLYFNIEQPPDNALELSMWSPNNGCGSCNTPTGSGRSTHCMCRSASQSSSS